MHVLWIVKVSCFVGYNLNANETGLWPFGENIKDERMIISSGSFIK